MAVLNKQELHNLAMNIVGKNLEELGFEFLAINSKLKKNPQFVALKDKKLHFIIVKAVAYPDDPKINDENLMTKIKDHAIKYNARSYYAGVGLANQQNFEDPVDSDQDYVVNYTGLIEL